MILVIYGGGYNDEKSRRLTLMNGELSFKINKEKLILLFLLSISVVNLITLILATIIACLYLLATNSIPRGSVKALLFITIRAQFNSGIAVGYDSVSLLKWSFVLGLSLLCLLFSHYKNSSNNAFLISLIHSIGQLHILLHSVHTILVLLFYL